MRVKKWLLLELKKTTHNVISVDFISKFEVDSSIALIFQLVNQVKGEFVLFV